MKRTMHNLFDGLEPSSLWKHVDNIRSIPRPSGQEEQVAAYVASVATSFGWRVDRDSAGNLLVRVPASKGRESVAPIALQAHLDMVCEKDQGSSFDFSKEPLQVEVAGEWLRAVGTTLGADSVVGISAALSVCANAAIEHGPVEILLTVDETTTGAGAANLDAGMVKAKRLVNLVSEEDDAIVIGCAGGGIAEVEYAARRAFPPPAYVPIRIVVSGLRGGHSGLSIHHGGGNAIRLLARVLERLLSISEVYLWNVDGGNKHNAIPREASAVVYLPPGLIASTADLAASCEAAFRDEFKGIEPSIRVAAMAHPVLELAPFDCGTTRRLVRLLGALPHGVLAVSREVEGAVDTSTNLATVRTDIDRLTVTMSSRAMRDASLRAVVENIESIAKLAGADTTEIGTWPAWAANSASGLLERVRRAFSAVNGAPPRVTTIHAGLETGILARKLEGVEIVSIGPRVEGAHAPGERVHIPSVIRLHAVLANVLRAS